MYSQSKGTRDHITAHIAVSATGVVVPPFLIFEKSFASGIYARLVPDNALNGTPPNGYMDSERFGNWVTNIFRPHTKHIRRPVLLILDSYVSHLDIKMIDRLIENGIHLFCLPPHTANILQLLHVTIFRPFKMYFSKLTDLVTPASLREKQTVNISKN